MQNQTQALTQAQDRTRYEFHPKSLCLFRSGASQNILMRAGIICNGFSTREQEIASAFSAAKNPSVKKGLKIMLSYLDALQASAVCSIHNSKSRAPRSSKRILDVRTYAGVRVNTEVQGVIERSQHEQISSPYLTCELIVEQV